MFKAFLEDKFSKTGFSLEEEYWIKSWK